MPDQFHLTVRVAALADAPEIARLNRLFNGVDEPPVNYARRLADPRRVDTPILAEINGRVIGIANLRLLTAIFYSAPYAELTELFVEESARRLGAGAALVSFAEQLARQGGAVEMLILTDFYNHAAQQLYRKCGYEHYDIALVKKLR
jgi:GNAT superfamily N-acetyltransferase